MDESITTALADVGPRLKRARDHRGVTLTELGAESGISKSTLSRLEGGQHKPSLELLLPIAQAHRSPLDELVGAPAVGDPRVRFTPQKRNGRTVIPLSQQPGGLQAWKVIIPPERREPNFAPTRVRAAVRRRGTDATDPCRPRHHHDAGRSRRIRHALSTLVRSRERRTGRDPLSSANTANASTFAAPHATRAPVSNHRERRARQASAARRNSSIPSTVRCTSNWSPSWLTSRLGQNHPRSPIKKCGDPFTLRARPAPQSASTATFVAA